MTNEKSSGGTAWVSPAEEAKHALDDTTVSGVEEEKIEGLLINEEEHLMEHDEEIPSEDELDPDTTERKMLTVALVHSVVETSQDDSEKRYGLRKRRRPTGEDLRVLEHNQSSNDGGLARSIKREDSDEIDLDDDQPNIDGDPNLSEDIPDVLEDHNPPSEPPAEERKPKAVIQTKKDPSTKRPRIEPKRPTIPPTALQISEPPYTIPTISASSTVPNPLSAIPMQPSTMSLHSAKAAHAESASAAVPCPLPAAAIDEKQESMVPESAEKRKVTISEPVASRSRAFSIDLDLGGFDLGGDGTGDSDLPLSGGGRNRAFSFECFAFGINADEPLPPLGNDTDSISTGRPRGDSIIFDPSSFQDGGIHEQNALEKACLSVSRKDSIADSVTPPTADVPVSKATSIVASTTPGHPGALVKSSMPIASTTSSATTASASSQIQPPGPVTSYTTTKTTATTTTTTTTLLPPAAAAASTTTFSMDLLNKDGRIGIYLPEARKARIARFHEKRARRIWRKRIKYDCRKKLADSRPRIKGRFVKRSDMEDE